MTIETLGTCEKHQLPLDVQGECQLCRLSEMPSRAPLSRGGRWVTMALIALIAGAVTWAVASFEPGEAPVPTRGVPNSSTRAAAPAVQGGDRQYQPTEVASAPITAPTAPVDVEVTTEEQAARKHLTEDD
jgi:hypothetical protein